MSKVIEFDHVTRLKRELASKDEEIKELKAKMVATNSVNEMLKLQLLDLLDQVKNMQSQFSIIEQNLRNLQEKLPQLD